MNTVAVIGLGYVGLPLVVEFGKHLRTIGFDISTPKVQACQRGIEVPPRPQRSEDGKGAEKFVEEARKMVEMGRPQGDRGR